MSKKYTLTTIEDILEIPADRFDDFLVDLKSFVGVARNMKKLVTSLADALGKEQPPNTITMHWIDDGKHEGKVIIKSAPKGQQEEDDMSGRVHCICEEFEPQPAPFNNLCAKCGYEKPAPTPKGGDDE